MSQNPSVNSSPLSRSSTRRRRRSRVRETTGEVLDFLGLRSRRRASHTPSIDSPQAASSSASSIIASEERGRRTQSLVEPAGDQNSVKASESRGTTPTPASRQRPVSEGFPVLPVLTSTQPLTSPELPTSRWLAEQRPEAETQPVPSQLPVQPRTEAPVHPQGAESSARPQTPKANSQPLETSQPSIMATGATHAQVTLLQDATPKFQKKVSTLRLEGGNKQTITISDFLDYIAAERLRRIPHQGGRWDHVLKWAEYYSTQVSIFERTVRPFVAGSLEASQMVYVCCLALLEMGPSQATALERAFRVLYEEAVTLNFFIRHSKEDFFEVAAVRQELVHSFIALVHLVIDIAAYYNRRSRDMKAGGTVTVNFYSLFGRSIRTFFRHKDSVANAMWSYKLQRSVDTKSISVEISTLRAWLGASTSGLPVSIANPKAERAEFSCEWFQPHLADFIRSKDDILSIEGQAGSGKSVLASWITERLQRPLHRRYIETISYFLDANVPSSSTPLNLVKGLLVQLLEKDVGDVNLYKSLVQVYELSTRSGTSHEIEQSLWEVLDHAVKNASDMLILVDGVNEVVGPEGTSTRIFERLHNLASKYFGVRLVVASQGLPKQYPKTHHFTLTAQHTHTDIYNLARHFLSTRNNIPEDDADLDKAAEQIAQRSQGSFVTANLILFLLTREKTKQEIFTTLSKVPNIDVVLKTLIDTAITTPEAKSIISWLLVAEESLTVDDLRILLETDITNGSRVPWTGDIKAILEPADALIVVHDGIVRFRHLSISEHLRHIASTGKGLKSVPEANLDFLSRILLHIKLSLTRDESPSTEELEPTVMYEMFHDTLLLQYTVRHWTTHFKRTTLWKETGVHSFTPEFKRIFPSVVIFPLLEKTSWETSLSLTEVTTLHQLALTIRETVLGKLEASVLQSYLNVATVYQRIGDTKTATKYFYSSYTISKTVLGMHSSLTSYFASTYLSLVATQKVTTRDELCNHKEEVLKHLIAHSKHEHDEHFDQTLKYKRMLAQLYSSVNETHKASATWREVHEATLHRYGAGSKEVTEVSRDLTTVLSKDEGKREEIVSYTRPIFDQAESTMEVHDTRRVAATIQMAETYEAQKDFAKAEELYILMWQRIAEYAYKVKTAEAYSQLLEVIMYYVAFLRRHNRNKEAANTLIGVWSEFEHKEISSDLVATKLTIIGRELRTLNVSSVAVSIFSSIWTYFKKTNRQSSKEAADVAILLTNTAKDVPDQANSKSFASVLMEVFTATFGSSTSTSKSIAIDSSTIHTVTTLSKYHVQQENWREAVEICQRILVNLWTSLTTFKSPEKLPDQYPEEATDIALRQAHCCWKLSQLDQAEKIYLYVFRATKSTFKVDDTRVSSLIESIISFYTTTNQTDKLVAFYEEVLTTYRKSLGTANPKTISTLYALAAISIRTNQKRAIELYTEILTALNKDSKVCHHEALDAAIALSTLHYENRNWTSAQSIFSLLWTTVTTKAKEYGMREEFVRSIYTKYTAILKEIKVETTVLMQVTAEYRTISISVFGAESEAALEATLLLAEMYSHSTETKRQQEAIGLYEESFKSSEKSKTTNKSLLSLLSSARTKLSSLYMAHATTNTANTEKATTLYREQYERSRVQYGWAHHSTLDSVRGLIKLWTRTKTTQTTETASKELQNTSVNIITTEKDSKTLYDSSIFLADTYIEAGLVEKAWHLLAELRRQIIFSDFSKSSSYGFKLDKGVDRSTFIWLSTFEDRLRGRDLSSFSLVYTDLLSESILYQSYRQHITKSTGIAQTLLAGARLRAFLVKKQRLEQAKVVEDELFELFLKALGAEIKTDKEITRRFFIIMLEELSKETHSPHLGNAACNGGNARVLLYLKEGKWQEAFDLGSCVFQFVHAHRGYHHAGNIGSGFKLSLYMAGRGVPKPQDGKVRTQMLELSQAILRDTLDACRHLKVEFVQMQLNELNDLIALMGEQKNYTDLEWLLTQLWNSRHGQKLWTTANIVSIGRRLVEVRFAHKHQESAIHLCQDICYNVRQVWGALDKTTIEMFNLLSALYTSVGRHGEAIAVHEGLLREEVSDDNEQTINEEAVAATRSQLELMKRSYQRHGKFDKDASVYQDLYAQIEGVFGKEKSFAGTQSIASWNPKDKADNTGTFVAPTTWEIVDVQSAAHKNIMHRKASSGFQVLMNGGTHSPKQ